MKQKFQRLKFYATNPPKQAKKSINNFHFVSNLRIPSKSKQINHKLHKKFPNKATRNPTTSGSSHNRIESQQKPQPNKAAQQKPSKFNKGDKIDKMRKGKEKKKNQNNAKCDNKAKNDYKKQSR